MRPGMALPLTVVKIGGSLLAGRRLRAALDALPAGRGIILVPGGGLFADAVRAAQRQAGFDDALAHRLALDAMGATAQVLQALRPDLVVLRDLDALPAAARSHRVPVWDPALLRAGHPDIPETWDVTSDSLGLWLARRVGARRLVLLKSVDAPPEADPAALAALGLVDEAFPAFAAGFAGAIEVRGPGRLDDLFDGACPALAAGAGMLDPALP